MRILHSCVLGTQKETRTQSLKEVSQQMGKTTYSNKRSTTRKKIDNVYIEHVRSAKSTALTVKELCEKAKINRSTFYTY